VRHAAPATRDWSAAQACENRCIESDWRALAWALSGLRVLFTRPAIPLQTMDDVSLAAQKSLALHRKSANRSWLDRYLPLLSGLLSGLPLSAFFIHRSHGTARLGWVFIALFFILDLLVLRLSTPRRELPSRQDQHAAILFYRQSLSNSSNRASTHFWFPPFFLLPPFWLGVRHDDGRELWRLFEIFRRSYMHQRRDVPTATAAEEPETPRTDRCCAGCGETRFMLTTRFP
jgi:hypothetical protein